MKLNLARAIVHLVDQYGYTTVRHGEAWQSISRRVTKGKPGALARMEISLSCRDMHFLYSMISSSP